MGKRTNSSKKTAPPRKKRASETFLRDQADDDLNRIEVLSPSIAEFGEEQEDAEEEQEYAESEIVAVEHKRASKKRIAVAQHRATIRERESARTRAPLTVPSSNLQHVNAQVHSPPPSPVHRCTRAKSFSAAEVT